MRYSQFLSLWKKSGQDAATGSALEQGIEQRTIDMWVRYISRKFG